MNMDTESIKPKRPRPKNIQYKKTRHPVFINGSEYLTMRHASREIDISESTIRIRLKSIDYPTWTCEDFPKTVYRKDLTRKRRGTDKAKPQDIIEYWELVQKDNSKQWILIDKIFRKTARKPQEVKEVIQDFVPEDIIEDEEDE